LLKCRVCNYESDKKLWIKVTASSIDGYTSLLGSKVREDGSWINLGSITLYGCPECGTVKVNI
jgi:ribosomal protein L37AE/L43A